MDAEGFRPPPPVPVAATPPAPSSGLKLLGIAQCALGAFGIATAPLALITRALVQDPGSRQVQDLLWDGWLGAWTYASLTLGTALAVLLIVAGVAVTRGRALGRKLSIAHALATLALVVVGQIVTALLLYPALLELAANGGAAERGGAVGGIAGGLLGSAVALVLPAIELVVMSRPQVKEQLSQ